MGHAARADDVEGGGRPVAAVLDVSSAKLQPGGGALAPLCFLMGVLSTLAIVSFGAQLFQDRVALLAPLLSNTPISSGEAAPAAPAADVAGPAPPLGEARERLAALRLPWQPALTRQEAERGLSYFGSGKRLRAVAAKLLAGQPIKAYALGGSTTSGKGASAPWLSFPSRFFQFLNASFPHSTHEFRNLGIDAANSGVFAACTEHLLPGGADLVVAEFCQNEPEDVPFGDPARRGYEQMLRKLLGLPGRPAVLQLHNWAWWHHARGGGEALESGLFSETPAEAQLTTLAQYYDLPALSLRAAAFQLIRAGVPGFRADVVIQPGTRLGADGVQAAPQAEWGQLLYYDKLHPSDRGHQVLAELLASAVLRAAGEVLAGPAAAAQPGAAGALAAAFPVVVRQDARLPRGLPPPMVPGNEVAATTLCAIQEAFKGTVVASSGFTYRPERPAAATFKAQKWAWAADTPGHWAELEFDSRQGGDSDAAAAAGLGKEGQGAADQARATVLLNYLRSYSGGMGTAAVTCVAGCTCGRTQLDGTWALQASLQQVHTFTVSQHERCRVRVTVTKQPGSVPQEGHKVALLGLIVCFFPVNIDGYRIAAAAEMMEGRP